MSGKTGLTGEIVKQYLERFPMIGALTLAKKIYAENSAVFTDVEHARKTIRYYLGQTGPRQRQELTDTRFVRPTRDTNPYGIPESDAIPWAPVHIPERFNNGLVFSDTHFPYHDVQAVNAMIDHVVGHNKINFIFINGDGLDCYQGSKFNRDPRNRSISDEIWGWIEFLNLLKEIFPGVAIYWKLGNHEERLEKYLRVKAPELMDFTEFKLGEILKIRGLQGIEVIERQIVYIGRLPIIHGHELPGGAASPVSPARGLSLKTLSSSVVSHHHKTSAQTETDINGKLMSWYSLGCLSELHPEYALINKWNHGFATIETKDQDFEFHNMKIYQGKVYSD
jgi:predicted phosphodiesterase